jgi:hypothetical protein
MAEARPFRFLSNAMSASVVDSAASSVERRSTNTTTWMKTQTTMSRRI